VIAKLLIDFLNEAELARALPSGSPDEKGISKLRRWLEANEYPQVEGDIEFLRALQSVRSKAVAHRKGSGYDKAMDRLFGAQRRAAAGDYLLDRAVELVAGFVSFARTTT
jgi:hypothetical protein